MKPVFAKILNSSADEVFFTRSFAQSSFISEFHFHTACQMNYVVSSSGYKVIGDCIENFEPGELTLLGSDLPHVWHNNIPANKRAKKNTQASSVTLFFNPEKLVSLLSNFYNTKKLEQVLQSSKRGMQFYGQTKKMMTELLFKMTTEEGAAKMISLLQLLEKLCTTKEYKLLASGGYVNTYHSRDNERMDKVFKYLFNNFSNEVKLDDVAAIANMNKQAFCRFFKTRSQKTLVEFINEIRIAHAIKLMNAKDMNIGAIAYDCGYNSISNFNNFFKRVTGQTPSSFKKRI